jgi:FkbM family methyltransferase
MHFRPNTTDFKVYQQIFMWHYMSYLYPIFENYPPKYILDAGAPPPPPALCAANRLNPAPQRQTAFRLTGSCASPPLRSLPFYPHIPPPHPPAYTGANAGFSTTLFKLLWPDAVVVSVEPDPDNYEALVRQTQGLEGVHTLNAGLWGRKARIGQTGDHGAWGKVFREKRALERGGMQAFGVADIAARFDIPAFDFVKIDIEGAEGAVFGKGADTRWTAAAKVISLEVHDYFADYFGLKVGEMRLTPGRREA